MKRCNIIVACLVVVLSMMGVVVIHAEALSSSIEGEIFPSQGGANTVILVRFIQTNASVGNVQTADIFWDNINVAFNKQGLLGADGSYNYNLTVPTELPYSEVGNHTIRVDSKIASYGIVTFYFTFSITEFVPSPEYLALNFTYFSLLANYTDALMSLVDFYELSANYTTLLAEHDTLTSQINVLSANYNSLAANYNSLSGYYNSQELNYDALRLAFNALVSNYTSLQDSLRSLNNYNSSITASYNLARGQLGFSTNVNYTLTITIIVLAITIAYLFLRKTKTSIHAEIAPRSSSLKRGEVTPTEDLDTSPSVVF